MTGMGVVIFHRVCGSPGTSRPRNHALFFPSISPSSLLLLFLRFVHLLSLFRCCCIEISFSFSFFFGNFVARWLLVVTGRLPELKGGYWLWICIILLKGYIYGHFWKGTIAVTIVSISRRISLYIYIYIDCYMSSWIIKTRSKIF